MTGEDKSYIYKTLNECVALLQGARNGPSRSDLTLDMDRVNYNTLLKKIAECKRILVRPPKDLSEF